MAEGNQRSILPGLLGRVLGSEVTVGVKVGGRLRGKLRSYDMHMNLVLDDAASLDGGRVSKRYGLLFIRGDGVVSVVLA